MADPGLLEAARNIVASAAGRDPWARNLPLVGIGWATVELERAAEGLAEAFTRAAMTTPSWAPGPRDELLGATTWVSRTWSATWDGSPPPAIVVLEPDTEGRLAATLARFGEGVAVAYLGRVAEGGPIDPVRLGRAAGGPLGSGRLVLSRPAWGPNVVVLDR